VVFSESTYYIYDPVARRRGSHLRGGQKGWVKKRARHAGRLCRTEITHPTKVTLKGGLHRALNPGKRKEAVLFFSGEGVVKKMTGEPTVDNRWEKGNSRDLAKTQKRHHFSSPILQRRGSFSKLKPPGDERRKKKKKVPKTTNTGKENKERQKPTQLRKTPERKKKLKTFVAKSK